MFILKYHEQTFTKWAVGGPKQGQYLELMANSNYFKTQMEKLRTEISVSIKRQSSTNFSGEILQLIFLKGG